MLRVYQSRRLFASAILLETNALGKLLPVNSNVMTAAKKVDDEIVGVLLDKRAQEDAGKLSGLSKVIVVGGKDADYRLSEDAASAIEQLQSKFKFSNWFAPHSPYGKDIIPRAAGLLGLPCISDIIEVVGTEGVFKRPIYAGNAIATIKCQAEPKFITVRGTAFEPQNADSSSPAIENVEISPQKDGKAEWKSFEESGGTGRPELSAARVVVSGGRAFKSREQFEQVLGALADAIPGASIGASRAAVDSGLAPNDWQIGQTGKIVAPALYIAIGISGAIQHVAGMKDSRVIVAINKDGDAPIFQIADFGLVGDISQIIPELTAKLQKL